MRRAKRYFLNAILLSAVSILMQSVSVSFNVYVSGKVGAEGMGLLTLISTVTGFSVTLATSGIQIAVIKRIAETIPYCKDGQIASAESAQKRKRIMVSALLYAAFFGILAAVLLFSLSYPLAKYGIGDLRGLPALRLYAFGLPFIAVASVLCGYFSAVRRVYKNVLAKAGEQAVKVSVVSALLVALAPAGATYACAAVVGGGAVSEVASCLFSGILYWRDRKKFFPPIPSEPLPALVPLMKPTVSIAFPIALSAYARSALLTVEHMAIPWGLKKYGASSEAALASYGVLHGMVFPLLLFPSAILSAFSGLLVPEIAECHGARDQERIERITAKVFRVSLLFSIGVAGIFVCFSHEIGITVYGSTEAAEHIRALAPLIPLMYLDGAVDSILKGMGEQLYSMKVNITDSLTGILMVVLLLPRMGIRGYRIVIFVCEVLNVTLSILKMLSVTKLRANPIRWIFKPLACIILSTLLFRGILDRGWLLTLLGVVGREELLITVTGVAILYLLLNYLLGSISRADLRWGKSLLHRET